MSTDVKVAIDLTVIERVKAIHEKVEALFNEMPQISYLDDETKQKLTSILEKIKAFGSGKFSSAKISDLDHIKDFLDQIKEAHKNSEEVNNGLFKDKCIFLQDRVLRFVGTSRTDMVEVIDNDLKKRYVSLLDDLRHNLSFSHIIENGKIPSSTELEGLGTERLLHLSAEIATGRDQKMYLSVQNLVLRLNELSVLAGSKRNYNNPKYAQFKNFLSDIGVTCSAENISPFSCTKETQRISLAALQGACVPVETLLPAAGLYYMDDAREEAEENLAAAWKQFRIVHSEYKQCISDRKKTEYLNVASELISASLDGHVRNLCAICHNKLSAKENAHTDAEKRMLSLLKLELTLYENVHHRHLDLKIDKAVHQEMFKSLVAVDKVLSEKEIDQEKLIELCNKIEARAPLVRDLLSKERKLVVAEEAAIKKERDDLEGSKQVVKQLSKEAENDQIAWPVAKKTHQEALDSLAKVKESQAKRKEELGAAKVDEASKSEKKKTDQTALVSVDSRLKDLASSIKSQESKVEEARKEYEDAKSSYETTARLFNEPKKENDLDQRITALKKRKPSYLGDDGFAGPSDHLGDLDTFLKTKEDEILNKAFRTNVLNKYDKKGYAGFSNSFDGIKNSLQAEGIEVVVEVFGLKPEDKLRDEIKTLEEGIAKLEEKVAQTKENVREKELKRLQEAAIADLDMLTERHAHLQDESNGVLHSIYRYFARDKITIELTAKLKGIREKLSSAKTEDQVLEAMHSFFLTMGTYPSGSDSRKLHMEFLKQKWECEDQESLDIYVESATRPMTAHMEELYQEKQNRVEELRNKINSKTLEQRKLEVEELAKQHKKLTLDLKESRDNQSALVLAREVAVKNLEASVAVLATSTKKVAEIEGFIRQFDNDIENLTSQEKSARESKEDLENKMAADQTKLAENQAAIVSLEPQIKHKEVTITARKKTLTEIDSLRTALGLDYVKVTEPVVVVKPTALEEVAVDALQSLLEDDELIDDVNDKSPVAAPAFQSNPAQNVTEKEKSAPDLSQVNRRLTEIRGEIDKLEGENNLYAQKMLKKISELFQQDIVQKDRVFKQLKSTLENDLETLQHCIDEKNFEFFLIKLMNIKKYIIDVDKYAFSCSKPKLDEIQKLIDALPDYEYIDHDSYSDADRFASIRENNLKLKQLKTEKQEKSLEGESIKRDQKITKFDQEHGDAETVSRSDLSEFLDADNKPSQDGVEEAKSDLMNGINENINTFITLNTTFSDNAPTPFIQELKERKGLLEQDLQDKDCAQYLKHLENIRDRVKKFADKHPKQTEIQEFCTELDESYKTFEKLQNPSFLARVGTAVKQAVKSVTNLSVVSATLAPNSASLPEVKQFKIESVSIPTTEDTIGTQMVAAQDNTDKPVLEYPITSAAKVSMFGHTASNSCRGNSQADSLSQNLPNPIS